MNRVPAFAFLPLAASLLTAMPAAAAERDKAFFEQAQGEWAGPGEIIAGKYKGTKFTCTFSGTTPATKLGMTLDGGCRVGMLTQKMKATVQHAGAGGYRGTFMDGAKGSGLDIVSGNVVDQRKVVLGIHRNQLKGVMQARLPDADTMTVSVSVRVEDTLVQVIGMNLKRVDGAAVGAIANR